MKLLIIDDEAHIRQLMRLTLEASKYEVDEAATGEAGLALFGDGRAHAAVLLDQKMPGLSGLETLVRLLERAPDVRVIMVTAFASVELAVDAMKLGAADFLRKPMTPETLRGAVAAALATDASPARRPQLMGAHQRPRIEVLTLNGFRFSRPPSPSDLQSKTHVFQLTHFPDGVESTVTVTIDPEAIGRVTRLTRRELRPGGAFWRDQAQRLLSAHLWREGKPPVDGRLTVRDVSREDLDVAEAWDSD